MDEKLNHYYLASRSEMIQFIPERFNKVLEIGCSSGNFSKNLRHSECELWGVEPNGDAAKEASTKIDKVLVGTFSELKDSIPNNYFDLVICNDVIEHMDDHDKFFEEIKSKMNINGVLIGSIPNILHVTVLFKFLFLRDWNYKDEGILDRTHLRFFTFKSLRRCLISHEYEITKFKGINSLISKGSNFRYENRLKDILVRIFTAIFIVITFGYYYDSQYPQIAFSVKK